MTNNARVSIFGWKRLSVAILAFLAAPVFAAQPEAKAPNSPADRGSCTIRRDLKASSASRAAKLPLHRATIAPALSDGDYDCRIYEQVDGECYLQCISELGITAKKQCREGCTYTVIECYTFPGII